MTVSWALDVYKAESNLLVNEEDILKYCPGGYHLVRSGDTLKDRRYTVLRKLRRGGFATVWAARDTQYVLNVEVELCKLFRGAANRCCRGISPLPRRQQFP